MFYNKCICKCNRIHIDLNSSRNYMYLGANTTSRFASCHSNRTCVYSRRSIYGLSSISLFSTILQVHTLVSSNVYWVNSCFTRCLHGAKLAYEKVSFLAIGWDRWLYCTDLCVSYLIRLTDMTTSVNLISLQFTVTSILRVKLTFKN